MPHFYRIKIPQPNERDMWLDDFGYCRVWQTIDNISSWHITRKITFENRKVLDTPGHPLQSQGIDRDVCVAPTGDCWRKDVTWIFEGCLIRTDRPANLHVQDLRVDGNLSIPVIDGLIPVYSPRGTLICYTPTKPIN